MTTDQDPDQARAVDDHPSVSVIVPVHGDDGEIALTARALAAQRYAGEFHVYVVDNGDNHDLDRSLAPLGASVTVLQESTPGSYAARNAALRVATGTVLAFTDGDCLPREDWLANGVASLLATAPPAFIGGAINLFAADASQPTLAELWDCANGLRQDHYVKDQGWAATANMLTTRSTMNRVGHFNAKLKSGGDREWGLRATAGGVLAHFAESAIVDHPARPTLMELHRKVRRVTSGDIDRRRAAGLTALGNTPWMRSLRPNTRSISRQARSLGTLNRRDRLRYVAVAHWMQYYFLFARVSYAMRTRRLRA